MFRRLWSRTSPKPSLPVLTIADIARENGVSATALAHAMSIAGAGQRWRPADRLERLEDVVIAIKRAERLC